VEHGRQNGDQLRGEAIVKPDADFAPVVSGRRNLRILHVCQPVDGGAAVVVRDLAAHGRQLGHDVSVACPTGQLASWVEELGARWLHLPLARSPRLADIGHLGRLRRWSRGTDVLHLHSSKAGALGRIATLGLRHQPMRILTPHGWSWYVGGRLAPLYRMFERFAAGFADVITVVSDQERADGERVLRSKSRRLLLIENGVGTSQYRPDGPVATRTEDSLLVCVGRLCKQKGQDLLVSVLPTLSDPRIRLRLVGDGPDRGALTDLAHRLGVDDRVEFVGATDPRPHLRAADIVVLPSRWEGMSLLLLEAMACGATIISSRTGGSSAVGESGIVVPVQDMGALRAAIEALMPSPRHRTSLGASARARAVAQYDLRQTLTRYEELWNRAQGRAGLIR
jgi:glycosyltransferase involved in cell wall biosynthesis